MQKLSKQMTEALIVLSRQVDEISAYDLAGELWGERYGGNATCARGRLQRLRSLKLAKSRNISTGGNVDNRWRITPAGRALLDTLAEKKP